MVLNGGSVTFVIPEGYKKTKKAWKIRGFIKFITIFHTVVIFVRLPPPLLN